MNDIRARFEEIWPVPHGTHWCGTSGSYWMITSPYEACRPDIESNIRLDTFTRCQEMTFSKEELNLFRQWFNAVEDLSPAYLEKSDCDLYRKLMEMMK